MAGGPVCAGGSVPPTSIINAPAYTLAPAPEGPARAHRCAALLRLAVAEGADGILGRAVGGGQAFRAVGAAARHLVVLAVTRRLRPERRERPGVAAPGHAHRALGHEVGL